MYVEGFKSYESYILVSVFILAIVFPEYGSGAMMPSYWSPFLSENGSAIDPSLIMEQKSKFLNNLFSKIPMLPFSSGDPKFSPKTRSAIPETATKSSAPIDPNLFLKTKTKMLNDMFSSSYLSPAGWIYNAALTKDKMKPSKEDSFTENYFMETDMPKKLQSMYLNSDVSALRPTPLQSLSPYPVTFDEDSDDYASKPDIIKSKVLSAISKELSSLKDDMLSTATQMQMSKYKKGFGSFGFMRPTTESPLQEKMDSLSKAFDALTKMEADVMNGGVADSLAVNGDIFPSKIARNAVENNMVSQYSGVQDDSKLGKYQRSMSVGIHQGYHSLPPGATEQLSAGSGSDDTHEGGGFKLRIKMPNERHHH